MFAFFSGFASAQSAAATSTFARAVLPLATISASESEVASSYLSSSQLPLVSISASESATESAVVTSGAVNTTVTEDVTIFTTYCPEPTTFTAGGQTWTVTAPTTITITECPEECEPTSSHSPNATVTPSGNSTVKPSPTISGTDIHPSNAAGAIKVGAAAAVAGALALLI